MLIDLYSIGIAIHLYALLKYKEMLNHDISCIFGVFLICTYFKNINKSSFEEFFSFISSKIENLMLEGTIFWQLEKLNLIWIGLNRKPLSHHCFIIDLTIFFLLQQSWKKRSRSETAIPTNRIIKILDILDMEVNNSYLLFRGQKEPYKKCGWKKMTVF